MGKEREVVMVAVVDVCRRPQHERGRHVLLGPVRPSSAVAQALSGRLAPPALPDVRPRGRWGQL